MEAVPDESLQAPTQTISCIPLFKYVPIMNLRRAFLCYVVVLTVRPVFAQPPQPGDVSPAKFEVEELREQKAPMRDKIELTVDIFRPQTEGKYPAILQITPYNKNGQAARARKFAAHGYVVINADSRGRFDSGGEWDPFTAKHKTDGYDLVQWIAEQPWCNGSVGMYGLSYMGWTQWWTASQSPPALKAIVPEVAPPDHLLNCPYQNGIFVCWMMDWAGSMSGRRPHSAGPGSYGGFAVNREKAYQLPYGDFDKTRNYLPTDWWEKWIDQNTASGEYWQKIAYQTPQGYAGVKVPSLAISGWFDANFCGTPSNYLGMKYFGGTATARRPRMVIGPWQHIINRHRNAAGVDFGDQAIINWDGYILRWFDHHLRGVNNGVEKDPPVHLFVMGRNEWRTATDWPLPETEFTKFYLHSEGKANSTRGDGSLNRKMPGEEPVDRYLYDPKDPTPSAGFTNGHIDGPRDISNSAGRNDVLVYETPPLTEAVELIGPIQAVLFAATDRPDTDWMLRLSDVLPSGEARFLAEGVMRARHRDPDNNGAFNANALSELKPNEPMRYEIDFWRPTGNLFAEGHRIRVEISSSYFPYYLRNPNGANDNLGRATEFHQARQTIYHDATHPSHLVLPIIPVK